MLLRCQSAIGLFTGYFHGAIKLLQGNVFRDSVHWFHWIERDWEQYFWRPLRFKHADSVACLSCCYFGLLLLCTCQQMVLVSACMTSFPECWTFLSYLCMSSTAVHTVSSRFFVAKFGLHLRLHWLSLCLYSIDFFGWRHCNLSTDNFQLFAHGLRCSTEIHACLQWKLWLLEQFSAFRVVSCPTNYTVSYYLTWQIACEVA